MQTFLRPGVVHISNAASATITGLELEATAAVKFAGLRLAGQVSWLDATYDRYLATGPGDVTGDAAGHRLSGAPEWSGSVSAVYEFATGRAGTASLRGDVSWQGRVFFTPFNTPIETPGCVTGLSTCAPASSREATGGRSPSMRATSATRSTSPAHWLRTSASPRPAVAPVSRASGAHSSPFAAESSRRGSQSSSLVELTPSDGRERSRRPSQSDFRSCRRNWPRWFRSARPGYSRFQTYSRVSVSPSRRRRG